VPDYPGGQRLTGHDLSGADLERIDLTDPGPSEPDPSGATTHDTASGEAPAATWASRVTLPPRARRRWTEFDEQWTRFGETDRPPAAPRPSPPPPDPDWRKAWLPRAVLSGFVATGVMTVILVPAYFVALSLGSPDPQATTLQSWLWGLANNNLTQWTQTASLVAVGVHFATGMAWALVYATIAEPRLRGPAWRRGVVFSLAPWVLSLVVFLPAVGGGLFGFALGAGPLPILGNLIVHLVYGAVLGIFYGSESDRFQTDTGLASNPEEVRILQSFERSTALGIVVGLALGALVGWLGSVVLAGDPAVAAVLGAIGGSLAGATIGSFWGMK
jgi:hypothetical protein